MALSVLTGSVVNAVGIILGGWLGLFLTKMTANMKDTVTKVMGIGILVLGIQMAMSTQALIAVLVCICLGAILGEYWQIEAKIHRCGVYLEHKVGQSDGQFSEAFVAATLLFVIGSMGIIGAIQSGIANDHTILFTKAVMDGVLAVILSSTMGVGIIFSAGPVLLYQGLIAIFASLIGQALPEQFIEVLMPEISAVGGILIIGISLNLMSIIKIRVSNVLPSLLLIIFFIAVRYYFC
ncbi:MULTISPECIES: DUF554 domain-containing protein [unclassified Enterococcus]|uniref:DUF554 domain-containing protein n=1 Tax=unclassified Enterococcus TaxID=2608891 RepID=UPI001557D174|nr:MULTISPECIES: DUF554 domain-containing protein [unclassified Enterococcus]MBS7576487.1 DUF554 domain-containing protein [Enterococcus sp. MMGLQ5-2]MBS7583719.1 DUF554 domain-containing protein [Enterococcus sp. MMGLQ5-1]NPD11580.1 DUF554 domain-containing protein [Enterococcus sp. MMGLQ5-1]NPD36324.1 DUF554 domain-containing protein [Enterococcus sp. MMGLQ5-2]